MGSTKLGRKGWKNKPRRRVGGVVLVRVECEDCGGEGYRLGPSMRNSGPAEIPCSTCKGMGMREAMV